MKWREQLLQDFARAFTLEPARAEGFRERFSADGLDMAAYQHAALVAAYFNFANRLVFAQSIDLEAEFRASCR